MNTFASKYPHTIRVKIAWGEMDALAHVNNIVYFRYMESARIAYFQDLGLPLPTTTSQAGPILVQIECQFKLPVTYPDELVVGSRIHSFGTTSMKMEHGIYSTSQEKLVALGDSVVVLIDYNSMQKVPVPADLREKIRQFQGD